MFFETATWLPALMSGYVQKASHQIIINAFDSDTLQNVEGSQCIFSMFCAA